MLAPSDASLGRAASVGPRRIARFTELLGRAPSILEVGCGSGIMGEQMALAGAEYVGIDIDSRMIDEARERGLTVFLADFLDYVPDRAFDVVTACQVVEHILEPAGLHTEGKRHAD